MVDLPVMSDTRSSGSLYESRLPINKLIFATSVRVFAGGCLSPPLKNSQHISGLSSHESYSFVSMAGDNRAEYQ